MTAEGVQIPLRARDGSVRAYVVVDAADAEWANQWRWRLADGYARREEMRDGRPQTILLHRELLGLTYGDGLEGDHIDRDHLNCRRGNLRIVTHAGNMQNRVSNRGASSKYRGVYWHKTRGKWVARVKVRGKTSHVGIFTSEEEAAEAARAARQRVMPGAVD